MGIFDGFYKFLFIGSLIYILYILMNLFIKVYGRFVLKLETKFIIMKTEKLLLWLTLAIFFTYLF